MQAGVRRTAVAGGWWLLVIAAMVLVLSNFDFGFRVTADHLQETWFAITHPWADWIAKAWERATTQGRIGHVLVYLLLFTGAYLTDLPVYGVACVAIFLAIVAATLSWAQTLAGEKIALPLFGVILALLPVGLYHWMPNAYAPQFLPLAIGLLAKAVWLVRPTLPAAVKALLAVLIFIAALSFETCFALLAAMAVVELWLHRRYQSSIASGRLTVGYVGAQWAILAVALVVYVGFRLAYPSQYEGNALPTIETLGWGVLTTFMHIITGPSLIWIIVRLVLTMEVDLWRMLGALVVGAGLYLVVSRMVWPPRRLIWALVAAGVLIALFVVAPIGFSPKYTEWCSSGHDCTYLDSRFALIGWALALPFLAALLVPDPKRARIVVAVLAALSGSVGYLANAEWRDYYGVVQATEIEAKRFVCGDPSGDADAAATVQGLLKADVPFHPEMTDADQEQYWLDYIGHLRAHRWWLCPD